MIFAASCFENWCCYFDALRCFKLKRSMGRNSCYETNYGLITVSRRVPSHDSTRTSFKNLQKSSQIIIEEGKLRFVVNTVINFLRIIYLSCRICIAVALTKKELSLMSKVRNNCKRVKLVSVIFKKKEKKNGKPARDVVFDTKCSVSEYGQAFKSN